jgi:hypothetical protein
VKAAPKTAPPERPVRKLDGMSELTAAEIHRYDQAYALRASELAIMVDAARALIGRHRREAILVGLSGYVLGELSHKACAELLSCAIEQMMHHRVPDMETTTR